MNNISQALNKYKTLTYLIKVIPKLKDKRLCRDVLQILYCLKVHGILISKMNYKWDDAENRSPLLKILQLLGLIRSVYSCNDDEDGIAFTAFQLTYLGQLYVNYAVIPTPQVQGQVHQSSYKSKQEGKSKTIWIQAIIVLLGMFLASGCVLLSWYIPAMVTLVGTLIAFTITNQYTDSGTIRRNKYEKLIKNPTEQIKLYNNVQSDENPTYYTYDDVMAFVHDLDPDTKTDADVPNFDDTTLPTNIYGLSFNSIQEEPGKDIGENSCYCRFVMASLENPTRINGCNFFKFLLHHQQDWHVSGDPYSFMEHSLLNEFFESE